MKVITQLDQVNMLMKHANRNNIAVNNFRTNVTNGRVVYAECKDGCFFTIYCFIENTDYLFKLI